MSCIHNVWNCYCKLKQDTCPEPCSPRCKDYCNESTSGMLRMFNKGPAKNVNCNCYESTTVNDYVSILEVFINQLYPFYHFGYFGLDAAQAEERATIHMLECGYDSYHVHQAYNVTVDTFKTTHNVVKIRLQQFADSMLMREHKSYPETKRVPYTSTEFRYVLTLLLGYLGKLDSTDIILCHDPGQYFLDKIRDVKVKELTKALNHTKVWVKESKDTTLLRGMRMVEAWIDTLSKENIPPKELTVAEIEKQLGYKIKIIK